MTESANKIETDPVPENQADISSGEGPAPIKNSKKKPNGANLFYDKHHAEYDARGKSGDKMVAVQEHNRACPKMYDELKKRRSIMKVTTISSQSINELNIDLHCAACAKLITLRKLRRERVKPKCTRIHTRSRPVVQHCTNMKPKRKCYGRCKRPVSVCTRSCQCKKSYDIVMHCGQPKQPKPRCRMHNKGISSVSSYNSYLSMQEEPMVLGD